MNILSIFVTGLFAGGLTCLAMQGGLLAASLSQQESDQLRGRGQIIPVLSFLITRLAAYTLLGLLLGALGSVAQISISTRVILQIAVSLFMIGTAGNLLQIHPVFRYFAIQPPKFLLRLIRHQSVPAILGAMTVLIPCGATQAMMAYAVTTGSPLSGAVTMFAFILGTSPLFFLLGYAAKKLGAKFGLVFNKISAVALILIALINLNNAFALSGFFSPRPRVASASTNQTVSEASIFLTSSGYRTDPAQIIVKSGSPVTLNLINQTGGGCIQAFTIPRFNIQRIVPLGSTAQISFTAPSSPQTLAFMCSMGMFRGSIKVI
jgi:sulfite exporter TauE/SafE